MAERKLTVPGRGIRKAGRVIPIGEALAQELKAGRTAQIRDGCFADEGFVVVGKRGRKVEERGYHIHLFQRLAKKIGLPADATLYSLRRTAE